MKVISKVRLLILLFIVCSCGMFSSFVYAGGIEAPPFYHFYGRIDAGGAFFASGTSTLVGAASPPLFPADGAAVVEQYQASEAWNFIGDIGLGWNISHIFRVDITAMTTNVFLTGTFFSPILIGTFNAHTKSYFYFANGYIDISAISRTPHPLHFYVEGGIGYARNKVDQVVISNNINVPVNATVFGDSRSDLAWHVGVEATYPIVKRVLFVVAYNFLSGGEYQSSRQVETGGRLLTPIKYRIHMNSITGGIIVMF